MVDSVIGYVAIIGLDLLLGLILLCCCTCYRTKRSKKVEIKDPKLREECPPEPVILESEKPLGELLSEVRKLSDEELCEKTTPEAVLYLVILRYIRNMLNIFAVLGMAICVPVYVVADDGDDLNMMMQTTIANVGEHLVFGIAPAVMVIVFTIIGYILIKKCIFEINKFSSKVKDDSLTSATMELYGLPCNEDLA